MVKISLLFFVILSSYAIRGDLGWTDDDVFVFPDVGRRPWLQGIEAAESKIEMAAYKVSDPIIMKALFEAQKRGVVVNILAQPEPVHNDKSGNVKTPIEELRAHGINVSTLSNRFNQAHYKMIVVDGTAGLISTGKPGRRIF